MISFKNFILKEGGNIKIKTPEGEVAAAPFRVKNRSQQAGDVRDALGEIHDSFEKEHGQPLFGKGKKALTSGSMFAGSTNQFMDSSISDEEFKKHKPTVGDIDAQFPAEHKDKLVAHLTPGRKFGKYTVVGTRKHGTEVSAVLRHENGEHHQIDFEPVHYNNDEPTPGEQLLHNSSWEDTKAGIKGLHHKVLLNAVGLDHHKFSISHGLRSRTDDSDMGVKEPDQVTKGLFGDKADPNQVTSFHGVTQLIKKHIPKEQHQAIYEKFRDSVSKMKGTDHAAALALLRKELDVKDAVSEESMGDQHASAIPMVGFSPISHMGHAQDLGGALKKLPGSKHIGISSKADAFTPEERKSILGRQWGDTDNNHIHIVSGAGETIRRAHDSMTGPGRKILHILVGKDRASFAEGLKRSLEQGKIKEMEGRKFDEIHIHYPEDTERTHGMSGTKMRAAANEDGDAAEKEFHRHLGPMFSRDESNNIKSKIKSGILSGKIPLKR